MTRRFDPLALVAGLVFIAIAVVGLTDRIQLSIDDVRWIAPILLVLFGILLLVTAADGNRRSDDAGDDRATVREPASVGGGAHSSDEVPDTQPADVGADAPDAATPDAPPDGSDPTAPQGTTDDR